MTKQTTIVVIGSLRGKDIMPCWSTKIEQELRNTEAKMQARSVLIVVHLAYFGLR